MNIISQLNQAAIILKDEFPFLLEIIVYVWGIQIVNTVLGGRLRVLGILPRSPIGLVGIFASPFIHGDWNHITMNTLFFLAMGSMLILRGQEVFLVVSISIMLIAGGLVWLFGRKALHVGASSIIMGYWSYLLINAYLNPNLIDIISAGLGLYYCGIHLTASLMANGPGVSEEGHIAGFIAGVVTAIYYEPIRKWLFMYVF